MWLLNFFSSFFFKRGILFLETESGCNTESIKFLYEGYIMKDNPHAQNVKVQPFKISISTNQAF